MGGVDEHPRRHTSYLAPYFAAKAAFDSLAVSYAAEVVRFGIDTTIIVPGSFTTGTNHFANAGGPSDTDTAQAYETRYRGLVDQVADKLHELAPPDADPGTWPVPSGRSSTHPR